MAASVAGGGRLVAAGVGVILVSRPGAPHAMVPATNGGTAAPPGFHPSWGVRLAVRAAIFLGAAVAVAAVVVLLGTHRAGAATLPIGNTAVPGAGPRSSLPVVGGAEGTLTTVTTPVTQTLVPVVQPVTPVTTPVKQTLVPVLQQVTPVTTPVTTPAGQAVGRVVPQATGSLSPVVHTLGPSVQPVAEKLGLASTLPTPAPAPLLPIGVPAGSAHDFVGPTPGGGAPPVSGPGTWTLPSMVGSSVSSAGSSLSALGSRSTSLHDGSGLPGPAWPFGGTTSAPMGSVGGGHGATGLSATLLARSLAVGLLTVIIGLIALWAAGRPARRPEVSPA